MFDDINNIKEEMLMHKLGQQYRAGHAKAKPIGDRMINAIRGAVWEGWEMGLDKSESIYPTLPLLEQMTKPREQMGERKQSPFTSHTYIETNWRHPALGGPDRE